MAHPARTGVSIHVRTFVAALVQNQRSALNPSLTSTPMPFLRLSPATLAVALTLATAACSSPSEPRGQPPQLTALPRDLTASERKIIDAANGFSFALLGKVSAAQPGSNVFVSPLSASFALGMKLNGAANQTFDEMRAALQFGAATQQEINDGYKSLIALLLSLDPAVTMRIANSIWYRNDFS